MESSSCLTIYIYLLHACTYVSDLWRRKEVTIYRSSLTCLSLNNTIYCADQSSIRHIYISSHFPYINIVISIYHASTYITYTVPIKQSSQLISNKRLLYSYTVCIISWALWSAVVVVIIILLFPLHSIRHCWAQGANIVSVFSLSILHLCNIGQFEMCSLPIGAFEMYIYRF